MSIRHAYGGNFWYVFYFWCLTGVETLARYFFNIRSGEVLNKDPEGEEHETLASAENEAILSAREIMGEAVKSGRSPAKGRVFELTDVAGQILSSIAFDGVLQLRDDTSANGIQKSG